MNYRNAVFIVVYTLEGNQIKYLLLKRKLHWKGWEFPKGGLEKNEKLEDAVKREVKEETGLNVKKDVKKLNFSGRYHYQKKSLSKGKFAGQSYSLFAVEANKGKVKLDEREHSDYIWLDFENAIKKLTWKNQKKCLEIVNFWLKEKKFRKIISSGGSVIFAGKDSDGNEKLIQQVEKDEEVFHTSTAGSPFVNIKGKAKKQDIQEAAIFCAKHSREWKKNKKDVIVHWFKGKDIYKTPKMKKGTFGVRRFKKIFVKKEDIEKFKK